MCACSLPPSTTTKSPPPALSRVPASNHQVQIRRWLAPALAPTSLPRHLPPLLLRPRPLLQLLPRPPSVEKRSKKAVSFPSSARASSAGFHFSSRRMHATSGRIILEEEAWILLEEEGDPAEDARALEGELTVRFDLFFALGGRSDSCSRGRRQSSRGSCSSTGS